MPRDRLTFGLLGSEGRRISARPSRGGCTIRPARSVHFSDWRRFSGAVVAGRRERVSGLFICLGRPNASLVLVLLWKFVRVAQHDVPLTSFLSVDLGAAKCSRVPAIADVPSHVLKVDRVGEVIMNHRHNVLRSAISRIYTFRGPVESGTHLLPSALVTAERAMITTSSARDHSALKGSGRPSRGRPAPVGTS